MTSGQAGTPVQHTAVVGNAYEMWSKLYWDIEVFQDIQMRYPDEKEPLGFAAINVCISASVFVEWVAAAIADEKSVNADNVLKMLLDEYPDFLMFRVIANTSKHSRYRDGKRPPVEARMIWLDGDEDCPPTWQLFYIGAQAGMSASESFDKIKWKAWALLQAKGLTNDQAMGPEWFQRKMRRIFPPLPEELLQTFNNHLVNGERPVPENERESQ